MKKTLLAQHYWQLQSTEGINEPTSSWSINQSINQSMKHIC